MSESKQPFTGETSQSDLGLYQGDRRRKGGMMSESKHTPGPWRVRDVHPDKWTRQIWTDESHGSVMIATAGGVDKDANALLISKSPFMYEALKELVSEWDTSRRELEREPGSWSPDDSWGITFARKILAEIRGVPYYHPKYGEYPEALPEVETS